MLCLFYGSGDGESGASGRGSPNVTLASAVPLVPCEPSRIEEAKVAVTRGEQ